MTPGRSATGSAARRTSSGRAHPGTLFNRARLKMRYYSAGLPWYGVVLRLAIDTLGTLGLRIDFFYLFIEPIGVPAAPGTAGAPADCVAEFLGEDDMAALARIPGRGIGEAALRDRLAQGQRCLGVRCRGEIVAFTWLSLNTCTFERHTLFRLRPNEAHLYDTYTSASFRGKSLAPFMRGTCYEALARLGRDRCYSATVAMNVPALSFKRKVGARIAALMFYVEILNRWRFHVPLKRYADGAGR